MFTRILEQVTDIPEVIPEIIPEVAESIDYLPQLEAITYLLEGIGTILHTIYGVVIVLLAIWFCKFIFWDVFLKNI